ncbi:YihY/virulence factor BrkB family protein [Mumia sp. Pv 4-285]|uniref:YihY/virulence factor BrkB family protein n=1 Tax=Mumia qirimensis TaxID=3234852 RepID=UPI00351D17D8
MGSLLRRAKDGFAALRRRRPFVDHVVRTIQHFGSVRGGILSGGITYFGFLSVFPILALAFFVVGYIAEYFPGADDALEAAISQVLPGIVTSEDPPPAGQISFDQIAASRNIAGVIGALGVLYTGLGFVSNLRSSLEVAFGVPKTRSYGFVPGKLRDLGTLVGVGLMIMLSVGVSSALTQNASAVLDSIGIQSGTAAVAVGVLSVVVGVATGTLLFWVLYTFLPHTDVPSRARWSGALLAAIGFEIVKQLASFLLGIAAGGALASLALSVTLLVWIYYFAQLTIYGASWAVTTAASRRRATVVVPHVVPVVGASSASPPGLPALPALQAQRDDAVTTSRAMLVLAGAALGAWVWGRYEKHKEET